MLSFNWKFLTPLALAMVIITAIMDKSLAGLPYWGYTLGMFAANVMVAALTFGILHTYARSERQRVGEPRPVARPDLASSPLTVGVPGTGK
jgi:ABC-type Na+ efflux pump permease subunit